MDNVRNIYSNMVVIFAYKSAAIPLWFSISNKNS